MRHIWGLDCLRFIAALLVVSFHFRAFGLYHPDFRAAPLDRAFPWMESYTWFGWIGVQIFFVISGFVIAASAMDCTTREFIVKRSIRVFPALWFSTLAAFAIRAFYGEPIAQLVGPLIKSMALSPLGPYIDGVIWTLVVELIFYIYIVILMQVPRSLFDRERSLELGAYVLGLSSCAFTAVHLYSVAAGSSMASILGRFFMDLTLLRHGMLFGLGMLVYRAWRGGLTPLIGGSLLLFTLFGSVQIALRSGLETPFWMPVTLWIPGLAVLLLSLRWSSITLQPRLKMACKTLGLLTYPLYLNHFTLGRYLTPILAPLIARREILAVVVFAMILGFSWFVLEVPERHVQRSWRKRFHVDRSKPAIAASLP